MSFLRDLYYKKLAENEQHLRFWEDYLNNLKALDFGVYSDKLKVPVLVPIGNKVLFRGELKHTNEVTVALGAGYFAKCSIKQAEVLRQHRIKDAQSKVNDFKKEKQYIEDQLSFTQQNVYEKQGQEIVEVYTEEEDKAWKLKHKENLRRSKQQERLEREEKRSRIEQTDEELWNRLEELELQEELEDELLEDFPHIDEVIEKPFVIDESKTLSFDKNVKRDEVIERIGKSNEINDSSEIKPIVIRHNRSDFNKDKSEDISNETAKMELLQKVLDKQNELGEKLQELRNKDRSKICNSEADLINKLDEMDELDELEDEMDRLEDIIETEDIDSDDDTSTSSKLTRSISFADKEEGETLQLTFKHSDTEPNIEPYDPKKGIQKPSDIYEAYNNTNLSNKETKSILKKSKYSDDSDIPIEEHNIKSVHKSAIKINDAKPQKSVNFQKKMDIIEQRLDAAAAQVERKTIVIKDVIEKDPRDNRSEPSARPSSLFKQRRQQMKS